MNTITEDYFHCFCQLKTIICKSLTIGEIFPKFLEREVKLLAVRRAGCVGVARPLPPPLSPLPAITSHPPLQSCAGLTSPLSKILSWRFIQFVYLWQFCSHSLTGTHWRHRWPGELGPGRPTADVQTVFFSTGYTVALSLSLLSSPPALVTVTPDMWATCPRYSWSVRSWSSSTNSSRGASRTRITKSSTGTSSTARGKIKFVMKLRTRSKLQLSLSMVSRVPESVSPAVETADMSGQTLTTYRHSDSLMRERWAWIIERRSFHLPTIKHLESYKYRLSATIAL